MMMMLKTFHLFQVDSPQTRDHRNANLLFAPIRLFCSSASSFVFFLLQSHSHTFGPSDIRHQEFPASVFRFSRKEMSSFRKETPCTVSVPSPTRPRGESFSLINALSSYNTSFSHDLLCFLDLPEPNNDNFPIGE